MNHLVAICDILGFSKLVTQHSAEEIKDRYFNEVRKSVQFAVEKDYYPLKPTSLKNLNLNNELGIAWFSDSILIYTQKDDEKTCLKFLQTIGWLIFLNMQQPYTRLRVGVSYGPAIMNSDEQIFIGLPIVEAYNLEKKQKWSGGALTKKVEERFGNYLASLNPVESWVIPYSIPMANGQKENLLAINWTIGIHNSPGWREFYWKQNKPFPDDEEKNLQSDVIEKWINTKEFHSRVCWHCFPHLNNGVIKPPLRFEW